MSSLGGPFGIVYVRTCDNHLIGVIRTSLQIPSGPMLTFGAWPNSIAYILLPACVPITFDTWPVDVKAPSLQISVYLVERCTSSFLGAWAYLVHQCSYVVTPVGILHAFVVLPFMGGLRNCKTSTFPMRRIRMLCNYVGSFSCWIGVRIGEAANPGPQQTSKPWELQIRNVISASAHADELFSCTDQCLVWSETCATQSTVEFLKQGVRKHKASLITSAPTCPRSVRGTVSVGRGSSSGALILSKYKACDLSGLWPTAVFQCGRVSDALISIGQHQLRVIGVYGYHSSIPNSQGLNQTLLEEVFFQAHAYGLPTLITGDLNVALQDLPVWAHYAGLGFQDLAVLFASLSNNVPEMTYRGISRLDYCIANPAACKFAKSFRVDPCGLTDHASLHVAFEFPTSPEVLTTWRMPMDMASKPEILQQLLQAPVSQSAQLAFCAEIGNQNLDAALHLFATSFENLCDDIAKQKDIQLGSKFKGRAAGKLVTRNSTAYVVAGDGATLTNQQQFPLRQKLLFKLRELVRSLDRTGHLCTAHQFQLWEKILRAEGFSGGSPSWILHNDIATYVPSTPSPEWLRNLLESIQEEEKLWASAVRARQMQLARHRRQEDWRAGGKQHAAKLKPPVAAPLTSLAEQETITVRHLRTAKGSNAVFRLISGTLPRPGTVWQFANLRVPVVSVSGDLVKLASPLKDNMAGQTVQQLTWNSDPAYVASEVRHYWKQFWFSSKQPDWSYVTKCIPNLPQLPQFGAQISVSDLQFVIRKLARNKARGLDGFSNNEVRAMSADMRSMLLTLFNTCTDTALWPRHLTGATVSLLSKVLQPMTPSDARPITILPTLYRVWAKCISVKAMRHLLPHLPDGLCGSVPGRCALDLAWELQAAVEEALATNQPLAGCSIDLTKAYNLISRPVLFAIMERLGFPQQIRKAYAAFSMHCSVISV